MEEKEKKWSLDYGRGYTDDNYDESSNKPFDFWLELNFVCLPFKTQRDGLGNYYCSVSCNEDFFELPDHQRNSLKEVFQNSIPTVTLYYEIAVRNQIPKFNFTKKQLEFLLDLDLNESEHQNTIYHLSRFTKIYLIKDNRSGLIKIGRSNDPDHRLKKLIKQDTLLPFPNEFELILFWEDIPEIETELHSKFAEKRIRGEWFTLNQEDIEKVKRFYKVEEKQ